MNEQALLDSLSLELSMIHALGFREVYITFAAESEKFTRRLFHVNTKNVIQCANFPGYVIDECAKLSFERVTLCGHPGKLLKLSAGSFSTHSRTSGGGIESLCTQLALLGAGRDLVSRVYSANTANNAAQIIHSAGYGAVWNILAEIVSRKCSERTHNIMKIDAVFIDGEGKVLGGYHHA